MPAEATTAVELHRMIALLEGGPHAHRPDVRALIERSERLLAVTPAPRPPSARRALGKLRLLARGGLDAAALGALAWGLFGGARDQGPVMVVLAVGLPVVWLVLRIGAALLARGEAVAVLRYHLAWGLDWFAEAASAAAAQRMQAREAAWVLMRGWRVQARSVPGEPRLAQVGDWLAARYGPHVAQAFAAQARQVLAMPGGDGAAGPAAQQAVARLRRLCWVPLMEQFALLASSGALWAAPRPPPARPLAGQDPEPEPEEPPEREMRRNALRDLIREKRAEIQRAEGWKMKTPAEIANRETYQKDLRDQVSTHQRELESLGVSPTRR